MKLEHQFVEVKQLTDQAKRKAYNAVNKALINLYWDIGKLISKKINQAEWGESIIKNLANYLKRTEPDMKGFSTPNLWRMKQFYELYVNDKKLSPLVREKIYLTQ